MDFEPDEQDFVIEKIERKINQACRILNEAKSLAHTIWPDADASVMMFGDEIKFAIARHEDSMEMAIGTHGAKGWYIIPEIKKSDIGRLDIQSGVK